MICFAYFVHHPGKSPWKILIFLPNASCCWNHHNFAGLPRVPARCRTSIRLLCTGSPFLVLFTPPKAITKNGGFPWNPNCLALKKTEISHFQEKNFRIHKKNVVFCYIYEQVPASEITSENCPKGGEGV